MYTRVYSLKPNENKPFEKPIIIWRDKILKLSRIDLHSFSIEFQLWRVSDYTFNEFVCKQELTFARVLKQEARAAIELVKTVKNDESLISRRKVKNVNAPIIRLSVILSLAEVYSFDCRLLGWTIDLLNGTPMRKRQLVFDVPTSLTRRQVIWSRSWSGSKFPGGVTFSYTGSEQSFCTNYIRVHVYEKPVEHLIWSAMALIGTAVINLKNVEILPQRKGMLKKLSIDPTTVDVGNIQGKLFANRISGSGIKSSDVGGGQPQGPGSLITELDSSERYLVVRLFRLSKLIGKDWSQSSNPSVEFIWDGYENRSRTVYQSLQPIFNETFHFPVRLIHDSILKKEELIQNCLPIDLVTKGPVYVKVWHTDDDGNIELLASGQIPMYLLTSNETTLELRSLLESVDYQQDDRKFARREAASEAADDEEEEEGERQAEEETGGLPFYLKKVRTRVFNNDNFLLENALGVRGEAVNSTSSMSFEFYFFPAMPEGLKIPKMTDAARQQFVYNQIRNRWERDWIQWQRSYREWYPQAPPGRVWMCMSRRGGEGWYPLCGYISPTPVPKGISGPGELLHWVSCISYTNTTGGTIGNATGTVGWNTPNHTLNVRKGTIQEHAAVLCSFLLGLGFDAYVALGTLKSDQPGAPGRAYAWVITRDAGQYVTHWDPLLKQCFSTPMRYGVTHRASPETEGYDPEELAHGIDVHAADEEHPYFNGEFLNEYYNRLAKQQGLQQVLPFTKREAGATDLEVLLQGGSDPSLGGPVLGGTVLGGGEEDESEDEMTREEVLALLGLEPGTAGAAAVLKSVDQTEQRKPKVDDGDLLLAPAAELCSFELASWLPYATLETFFNNEQVYGNLQNADPTVIYYDVESPYQWRPLLGQAVAPVDTDVFISPPPTETEVESIEQNLAADLRELIQLARNNKGLTTQFENSETYLSHLNKYLEMMEYKARLDVRCISKHDMQTSTANHHGTDMSTTTDAMGSAGDENFLPDMKAALNVSMRSSLRHKTLAAFGLPRDKSLGVRNRGVEAEDQTVDEDQTEDQVENQTGEKRTRRFTREQAAVSNGEDVVGLQHISPVLPAGAVRRRNRNCTLPTLKNTQHYVTRTEDYINVFDDPDSAEAAALEDRETAVVLPEGDQLSLEHAGEHAMLNPIESYSSVDDVESEEEQEGEERYGEGEREDYGAGGGGYGAGAYGAGGEGEAGRREGVLDGGEPGYDDEFGDNFAAKEEEEEEAGEYDEGAYMPGSMASGRGSGLPLLLHDFDFNNDDVDREHYTNEMRKWETCRTLEDGFRLWRKRKLPVKDNCAFCGVPVHLAGSDVPSFRAKLLSAPRVQPLIDISNKNIAYVITAKAFPLVGGLISCWIFLGVVTPKV
ncbi:C2 domain protein [Gregarina niphandrodes]|uniref:C2 domain protein n=1 Tax=Gregarina niphandrodes TaxID=110365 RepID=A0A023B042_GRENI|nr:C2 domain protein [Gregarina niphandrodes]EZG44341.1 C2 domain protein [Gregarina niphandrodes]|eukprot:XP_011132705.1 C2 domain protein [Gregarina niphandrodes]